MRMPFATFGQSPGRRWTGTSWRSSLIDSAESGLLDSGKPMLLLSAPFDATAPRARSGLAAALIQTLAAALVLLAGGSAVAGLGGSAAAKVGRALMSAALHAGFFAAGWAFSLEGRAGWYRPALRIGTLLLVASVASQVTGWGAAAYLVVPLALIIEARRWQRSAMAGLAMPNLRSAIVGVAAGAFLGGHLLLTSALTLGYVVRIDSAADYLGAVAYDVGANALGAEWLFRGALFSRWWRRWPFVLAAALATGGAVCRYLFDPNLPTALETRLGAV